MYFTQIWTFLTDTYCDKIVVCIYKVAKVEMYLFIILFNVDIHSTKELLSFSLDFYI